MAIPLPIVLPVISFALHVHLIEHSAQNLTSALLKLYFHLLDKFIAVSSVLDNQDCAVHICGDYRSVDYASEGLSLIHIYK